jgi:alpha-beta hydrolase superfamily lysophospholipase
VHGYAEHTGRHAPVAHALTDQGATVYAYDQRGHGQSEGRRAYVGTFTHYLQDLHRFLQRVRAQTTDRPLFLFGHSMGGLVVLSYLLDRQPSVDGVILSSPAVEINPDLAPVLRRVGQWIGRLAPTLPTTRSPKGALSRDPDVAEAAQNDPLNYHGRVPARTGAEMLRVGGVVQSRLHSITAPFLVVHGTADLLTSPEWSRRLYDRAASDDKTIRLYDGLYHETFNEPEGDEVLATIGDWLDARCP